MLKWFDNAVARQWYRVNECLCVEHSTAQYIDVRQIEAFMFIWLFVNSFFVSFSLHSKCGHLFFSLSAVRWVCLRFCLTHTPWVLSQFGLVVEHKLYIQRNFIVEIEWEMNKKRMLSALTHAKCCCFMRIYVCMCACVAFVCLWVCSMLPIETRVSCCGNRFMKIKRRGTLFVELCARCIPLSGMSVSVEVIINVLMTTSSTTAAAAKQRPKHNVCQHSSELVLFETFYHKERWNIATLPSRSELCGTAIPLCIVYVFHFIFVLFYFRFIAFVYAVDELTNATCALCTINSKFIVLIA